MPPPITLPQAQAIKLRVRGKFSSGFKSSNKVYHYPVTQDDAIYPSQLSHYDLSKLTPTDLSTPILGDPSRTRVLKLYEQRGFRVDWSEKYRRRNQNALGATLRRKEQAKNAKTPSEIAAALEQIREAELAGNCKEMAIYAARIVSNEHPDAREFTYLATLEPPGDHEFCVVGKDPRPGTAAGKVASIFMMGPKFSDWVVIDPWLNVCCLASNYNQQAALQLQKWANGGKRILWNGKFYLPTGSYESSILNSGVKFKKFA